MKRHTLLVLSGLATLSLAACSSDSGSKVLQPGGTSGGGGTAASVVSGGNDPAPIDASSGTCQVKVTGDVSAEWTAGGGSGSIGYGPWVAAPGVTSILGPLDESFFIVNCDSNAGNYVGFLTNSDAKIPMEPATYVIPAASPALGGGSSGPLGTVITLDGTDTNWMLSGDGEFVITEFDSDHIAGHFTLPITDALAGMTGTSKGNAVMTGSFEFANPS